MVLDKPGRRNFTRIEGIGGGFLRRLYRIGNWGLRSIIGSF